MSEYPSMLWVTIPPVVLLSAYLVRKWYLARQLRLYGIGKGAPGFQTNVRRIRVTPEIAARLERGEEVSPEEIAAASAQAEDDAKRTAEKTSTAHSSREVTQSLSEKIPSSHGPPNEWLPESITAPKKRAKGKKR